MPNTTGSMAMPELPSNEPEMPIERDWFWDDEHLNGQGPKVIHIYGDGPAMSDTADDWYLPYNTDEERDEIIAFVKHVAAHIDRLAAASSGRPSPASQ
jgi:hypothetical protein